MQGVARGRTPSCWTPADSASSLTLSLPGETANAKVATVRNSQPVSQKLKALMGTVVLWVCTGEVSHLGVQFLYLG